MGLDLHNYGDASHKPRYKSAPSTVNALPSFTSSRFLFPNTTERGAQTPSIHLGHGYPLTWAHGGHAYGYWHVQQQQQQQQQQPQPPPPLSPPPPPPQQAQPLYKWPGGYHGGTNSQHLCSGSSQQLVPTYSSYLSAAGVPFDLRGSSAHSQIAAHSDGLYDPMSRTYRYTVLRDKQEPFAKFGSMSTAEPSYGIHSATIEPPSTPLPYHVDDTEINEKPFMSLVRDSTEPSIPQAQPYQGRRKDEPRDWDKHYGFCFAVPRPGFILPRYPPATNRDGPSNYPVHLRRNFSPVSLHRGHSDGGMQQGNDRLSFSRDTLFRTHNGHGRGQQEE